MRCTIVLCMCVMNCARAPSSNVVTFDAARSEHSYDSHIDAKIDLTREKFLLVVPPAPTGVVVFISSEDSVSMPPEWAQVLERHHLIFVAPFAAGNTQAQGRRYGLAVLALEAVKQRLEIEPSRVYVAGISGGARTAGDLAFYEPDLFHGTIQNCGSDFPHDVPTVLATSHLDTLGNPYGVFEITPEHAARAKAKVRFTLITGSNDFRHGNVLDLYTAGFAAEGYHAKLFDVAGMGHTTCNGETLEAALSFLEAQ